MPSYPNTTTTAALAKLLAGGDDYIRTLDNQVRGLALRTDLNPDAPDFVVFGRGPRIVSRAELYLSSGAAVPVYIKLTTNSWRLAGLYRAVDILRDTRSIAKYGACRPKGSVDGVLQLERADSDDVVLGGTGFPDAKTRRAVELAAVEFVSKTLTSKGFSVTDVQRDNRGYDLLAVNGKRRLLVEVKGTDLSFPRFFLSRNELSCAQREAEWRLFVVVSARDKPKLLEYTCAAMQKAFRLEALSWQGIPADA